MREDLQRWDRKYRDRGDGALPPPEPLLIEQAPLLPRGDALDVACGLGQNALWLAARGNRVTGIDGSAVGLRKAAQAARAAGLPVRWLCADLDWFTPAAASTDLVVVVRFLDRALLARLVRALRPGGLVFYRTFNVNRLREDGRFTRAYLLECGELRSLLGGLEVLAGNDEPGMADTSSWLLARRPAAGDTANSAQPSAGCSP